MKGIVRVPSNFFATQPALPRALVTGANGFMGQYMQRVLMDWRGGYDMTLTDIGGEPSRGYQILHSSASSRAVPYAYEPCDLRDGDRVAAFLKNERSFDVVFHVAGLFDYAASVEDLRKVNVEGAWNLIRALASHGIDGSAAKPKRIVVWGAGGVYDFAKESPAKETSPTNPKGGYLTSKYDEEMMMLEWGARLGVPVTILRPCGVYGSGSRYGVALSIMLAARGGMGPFYFGPGNTRAGMVHALDVCRAAAFLANRIEGEGQIFNVNDDCDDIVQPAYRTVELMRSCAERLDFPLLPINFPIGIMRFFIGNLRKKAAKKNRVSILTEEMTDLLAYDALLDASKLRALGWRPSWPDSLEGLLTTIEEYEKEDSL